MINTTSMPTLSRRAFVFSATAAATLGLRAKDEAKPILRIGAMSDDHFHAMRPATHTRSKACFELFRRLNADIVVDTGDIADRSDVSELRLFRRLFDEAFAGTDCVPFFCIANHDYNYVPGTRRNDPQNIENAWRALGMSGPNPSAVVKGYRFVNVFQDEARPNAFAEAVAQAVSENEGNRPVFVVNHVPPMLTTTGSVHWSSQKIRNVLNRYPQVVALTGHIHTAISWAANIWQGEFTAVNLGAHAEYSNKIDGEAVVLDVFDDRIDIRRYEAVSGREIGADDRWSIPLPLDPAHGPYRTDLRRATMPVPALPSDTELHFVQNADGDVCSFTFPSASPRNVSWRYRFSIESQAEDGVWTFASAFDWETPQVMDEPATWTCRFSPAILAAGRPHRVTVTPANSHGVDGASRTFAFDVPTNPMTALPAELTRNIRYQRTNVTGKGVFTPNSDGWFDTNGGIVFAVLPKAFSAAIRGKRNAVLCFDIASDQPHRPNTFSIARFPADGGAVEMGFGARFYTRPGKFAAHRYAWSIGKATTGHPDDEYALVIREGDAARFRVNGITCLVR